MMIFSRRAFILLAGVFAVTAFPLASFGGLPNSYYDFIEPRGNRKLIVLLVKTKGSDSRISPEEVWSRFFGREDDDLLSVAEYYDRASYGSFHLEGTVSNWIELPHPINYYAAGRQGKGGHIYPRNMAGFVTEAARQAYTSGAPIDNFDNTGDGHIDGLVVLYSGALRTEAAPAKRLWPRMDYVSVYGTDPLRLGSAVLDRFILVPEYVKYPGEHSTRVYAHEVGHLLGLFDLYDKDKSSYGIGCTGLMSMAPPSRETRPITGLSAFSKNLLGWAEALTVTRDMNVTLEPLHKNPRILKMPSGDKGEYFLLSFREPAGNDKHLYGSGLLLWHVNEDAIYENRFECNGLCESGPLLSLVQADGKNDLERRMKAADAADFFVSPAAEVGADTGASEDPFAGAHTMTYRGVPAGIRIKDLSIKDHKARVSIKMRDNAVPFHNYPYFKIIDRQWTEIEGNGNGFPDKGELARLTLTIINLGRKADKITVVPEAPETFWYESPKRINSMEPGEKLTFGFKVRLAESSSFQEAWIRMFNTDGTEERHPESDEGLTNLSPEIKISSDSPEVEMEIKLSLSMGVPSIFMVNDSSHDLFPYCLRSLKRANADYLAWNVREQGLPSKSRVGAPPIVIWLSGTRSLQQGIYPGPARVELFRAVDKAGHSLVLSASRAGENPASELLDLFGLENIKPAAGFQQIRGYPDKPFSRKLKLRGRAPYYPALTSHLRVETKSAEQRLLRDLRGNCVAAINWKEEEKESLPRVFLGFPWEALPPAHGALLCKRILGLRAR